MTEEEKEALTYDLQVTIYASVGALAVLIWDILDNWHKDYKLLFGSERKGSLISAAVYVVSRIAALGYAITVLIFYTVPLHRCQLLGRMANGWCPVALTSTAYLFFLRLCAVYTHSKAVRTTFLLFFLGLVAAVVFFPFSMNGGVRALSPSYCGWTYMAATISIEPIAPLVYDTLVFLAISWRLSRNSPFHSSAEKDISKIVSGRNLPTFTRMILQDGQLYYFITLLAGLGAVILSVHSGVPKQLKLLVDDPYLALVNIMACRVYRHTLSALFHPSGNMDLANQTKASRPIIIKSPSILQETAPNPSGISTRSTISVSIGDREQC